MLNRLAVAKRLDTVAFGITLVSPQSMQPMILNEQSVHNLLGDEGAREHNSLQKRCTQSFIPQGLHFTTGNELRQFIRGWSDRTNRPFYVEVFSMNSQRDREIHRNLFLSITGLEVHA